MEESDIEQRVRILEDIEAIKNLKARYWNSVDTKQWEVLADCYTADVVFQSPQLGIMDGRDYIIKVLKRAMKNVKTSHQGHNPEIEIQNTTHACGRWALNDRMEMAPNKYFCGYGYYQDDYIKENGCWKINKSTLTYIFQEYSPGLS
jgi:hypothetical protein